MHKKKIKNVFKTKCFKTIIRFTWTDAGHARLTKKTGRKKEQERLAGKLVSPVNRKKRQKDKKEKYEKEKIA